jgi:hypothetical protein
VTGEEIAAALDAAAQAPVAVPAVAEPSVRAEDTWRALFEERVIAVDGGHLHWSGATTTRGTPVVACGGQVETAYRLAFRWHHGREPVGNVRPRCGYPSCLAGGHLADRLLRTEGAAS